MECSIAVIGTGSIGMRHLNLLKQISGVSPVAIPKRRERQVVLQSQGFQIASSLSEAVKRGTKLAIIASNTERHQNDALQAIDCEMDLLVEKPLSTDAENAAMIVSAARKKNQKLFVGCVLRFSQSLQTFREWLPKIGKAYAVRIECQSYLPDWRPQRPYQESYSAFANEGGVLRDLIHEIDYAIWIFGQPKEIRARLKNTGRLGIEAEEFAEIWWETKEGVSVSICLDYLSRVPRRLMSAFGEHGNLVWDGVQEKICLQGVDGFQEILSQQSKDEMYLEELKAFLQSCSGAAINQCLATGFDGLEALKICDEARQFAHENH